MTDDEWAVTPFNEDIIMTEKERNKRRNLLADWRAAKIHYISMHVSLPTLLEQTAEECVEMAHACLKFARYLRDENPVSSKYTEDDMLNQVNEEFADILVSVQPLPFATTNDELMDRKLDRWIDRIANHKRNA